MKKQSSCQWYDDKNVMEKRISVYNANDDDDDDDDDISQNATINDCDDEKLLVMSSRLDWPDEPEDFLCMLQQQRKNNPRNLTTGSLNINSIRNKFDAVQHMLKCQYMDIYWPYVKQS